jgi:hypothetical protein
MDADDVATVAVVDDVDGGSRVADTRRMQWLRWLLITPSHSIEAIQHANRLLGTLFLENFRGNGSNIRFTTASVTSAQYWMTRLVPIKTLQARCLPVNFLETSYAALEERCEAIGNQAMESARLQAVRELQDSRRRAEEAGEGQGEYISEEEIEAAAVVIAEAEAEKLEQVEKLRWESAVQQQLLWSSFVTAMEVRNIKLLTSKALLLCSPCALLFTDLELYHTNLCVFQHHRYFIRYSSLPISMVERHLVRNA